MLSRVSDSYLEKVEFGLDCELVRIGGVCTGRAFPLNVRCKVKVLAYGVRFIVTREGAVSGCASALKSVRREK